MDDLRPLISRFKSLNGPSRNPGTSLDIFRIFNATVESISINLPAIQQNIANLYDTRSCSEKAQIVSLIRSVACMDLTTLNGDDTESNVQRLCHKAVNPIDTNILHQIGLKPEDVQIGAVCVYPSQIKTAVETLHKLGSNVPVAAVAAGFPSGQYHLNTRLGEIKQCVADGAKEIDIVISRDLALQGKWQELYNEVRHMKESCGTDVLLKTIIAAGELGSIENIYKASLVCMAAGADFIKTSTGKESVNATLPIAATMTRAIHDYHSHTGFEVGFKPAGGIRTAKDVYFYQCLMAKEVGFKWLFPDLFRIGASSLLADVEQNLFLCAFHHQPSNHVFSYL